jgi:Flp pilus assembly protein TadG
MSSIRRRSDERGAAAVELALLIVPLLGLLLLAAALPFVMLDRVRLERAVGQAARFATMQPDRGRPGVEVGERRPTDAEVAAEVERAYTGTGTVQSVRVTTEPAARCARRVATSVEVTTEVDLGPFGFVYRALRLAPRGSMALTASANNCQE